MRTQSLRSAILGVGGGALLIVALTWWFRGMPSGGWNTGLAPAGELRLPILATSALQTLDPIKSAELIQYNLDLQIFECLVAVAKTGELIPALAEKWEVSSDGTVWTFHLRNARFADDPCFPEGKGRLVTTDDIFYSWKRGLSAKLGSLNSWALSKSVAGAEAFALEKTGDIEGFEKIDSLTFRVRLAEPDRNFATRLTVLSTAVVPREAVERYGDQFGSHPVGTGPFRLKEWIAGESVLLERNASFGASEGWQPKAPTINRARFIFFRSEAQMAKAFAEQRLDVRDITGADLAQLSNLSATGELEKRFPTARVFRPGRVCRLYLLAPLIGSEYAFGSSPALRRHLVETFDHPQLSASAIGPLGVTTKTLMLPSTVLVDAPPTPERGTYASAPATAPQTDAPLRGKTVKVAYVSSRSSDVAVSLLRTWLETRGASMRSYPSASINALFASVGDVKPDLTLIYWSPYYPNLENYITALLTGSRPVPNFTGYSNPELDAAAAGLKVNESDRLEATKVRIGHVLDEEMPWIPLYYETPLMLAHSRVKEFSINPVSVFLLSDVRLQDAQAPSQRGQ